ncbi:hypothetical protein ALP8811_02673 [Aliiroseovarius pelagivivens]|uniref:Uncharacterized protein n=1 Tax=Aliiroseovarius pelagivivens TaxID=1639690 RepID=A0A2R8ARR5_9RHOB|nr:hypothetical protein [Aliiroseovarius pelagivivens]SPF78742.1 hypothetical protein ALP8811_02673 [Aliiroseovarius pelagivivens]
MTRASDITKLQIDPRYLLIMLLPVVVLIVAEYLLGTFGDTAVHLEGLELKDQSQLIELSARYRFLAALFFFGGATISVIAIFVFELYSRHTRRSILTTLVGILGIIVVSLSFSTFEPDWMPASFESQALLGDNLFHALMIPAGVPGCDMTGGLSEKCDQQGAYFAMEYLLDRANILTSLSAGAVIAGMVLALSRPASIGPSAHPDVEAEARILKSAQEATQRYLYCSGILLTAGMVLMLSWMSWPGDAILNDDMRKAHAELVSSLSIYRGVTYSVLILSYYLPVSLFLKVRIDAFHDAVDAAGKHELAAGVAGFDIQRIATLDALKAIIAIVSPILTGAIGSFGNLSGFGG